MLGSRIEPSIEESSRSEENEMPHSETGETSKFMSKDGLDLRG